MPYYIIAELRDDGSWRYLMAFERFENGLSTEWTNDRRFAHPFGSRVAARKLTRDLSGVTIMEA